MSGPKAEPKPAHAKPTRPRMVSDGLIARTAPMTAMTTTAVRERLMSTPSLGSFLATILYRSSMREEETTSSWEDMVDMIAASTAVRTRPAMSGWNRMRPMSRKMVSKASRSVMAMSGFWEKKTVPIMAVKVAPMMHSSIQPTPIQRPTLAWAGEVRAMKRTTMWGWPK